MKSRFPFTSFPNGWFRVAYSKEVPPKGVIPLHYFGKDLVLFRLEDGTPHILDAYCPHLGAHLGYGGRVEGEAIQCPFHGWWFNGNGDCIDVPYVSRVPPKAKIRAWSVREVNGLIMVYYHALGKPPTWEIPELPEYNSEEWTPFHRGRQWRVRSHTQEIVENGVDTAHLPMVHSQNLCVAKDDSLEVDGQVLSYRISTKLNLSFAAGILNTEALGAVESTSYGLGCFVVRPRAKVMIELRFLAMFLLTPINEEYLDVHMVFSMKKVFNKAVTRALLAKSIEDFGREFEQDIPIWENKVYRSAPILCDGDGPIAQFRRWASQFYSDVPVMTGK